MGNDQDLCGAVLRKKIKEYNSKAKETEERIDKFKKTHSKRIAKKTSDISRLRDNVS